MTGPFHASDTFVADKANLRTQAQIDVQRAEEVARKAADLHFLTEGFDEAKRVHAAGVMVIFQADLNFNNEQHLTDTRSYDAFQGYIDALRDASMAFAFPGQVRSCTAIRTTSRSTSP